MAGRTEFSAQEVLSRCLFGTAPNKALASNQGSNQGASYGTQHTMQTALNDALDDTVATRYALRIY